MIAFCMALLWMPLTAHCALEASGIFDQKTDSCCDHENDCSESPCSMVAEGKYSPATNSVTVPVPEFNAWDSAALVRIAIVVAPTEAVALRDSLERPPDWVVNWHFVRRAVGSPRAPAIVA
jgi:hypothetical protein